MRQKAQDKGALQVFANTEVLDVDTEPTTTVGKVTAVVTDKGRIEAEHVVIACGVWSNRVANMAGATIPLVPAVHQMADVGPHRHPGRDQQRDRLSDRSRHGHVLLRAPVGRLDGGRFLRPPSDLPPPRRNPLQRGSGPVTDRDAVHPRRLRRQMEQAIELMDMLGDAEIKYAINGLLSLTPDAMPCLGETAEVAQPVVGRCGVGQGGAGHGPGRGRVDDLRLPPGHRRPRLRHRPLLRLRAKATSTSGPGPPSTSTRPTASSTQPSSGRADGG